MSAARTTPYERVFGGERFAERDFPAIAAEAEEAGLDPARREEFALVARVGILLQDLAPEEASGRLDPYRETLFHAFHFWRAGRRVYDFDEALVRFLVESALDLGGGAVEPPHEALYVALPRNLFWAAVTDRPPEPVEGMFVKRAVDELASVELLLVLGMREDRPGFSTAGLTVSPREQPAAGAEAPFRADIPGADLAGLYSLERTSEIVILLRRLLWYLKTHPEATEHTPADEASGGTIVDRTRVRLTKGKEP